MIGGITQKLSENLEWMEYRTMCMRLLVHIHAAEINGDNKTLVRLLKVKTVMAKAMDELATEIIYSSDAND